jgi:hypothetical protein
MQLPIFLIINEAPVRKPDPSVHRQGTDVRIIECHLHSFFLLANPLHKSISQLKHKNATYRDLIGTLYGRYRDLYTL